MLTYDADKIHRRLCLGAGAEAVAYRLRRRSGTNHITATHAIRA
jgi:hypothetical protein